ncbi:MAG: HDOD domain-containing protein [Deltaproteobacteria bacterium]|nr:HDOD domain-containing protein [Deltaproteobacteria bacterium]
MSKDEKKLARSSKKKLPIVFSELSQKDLKSLYACSEIRVLKMGEFLLKEGDIGHEVYVILEGELKIVKGNQGRSAEIARVCSGDCVGEISFSKKVPRTASAIASVPSRVMAINEAALKTLNAESQLFFLKRLNDLSNKRISQLISNERDLTKQNKILIAQIHSDRSQRDIDYSDSAMIRSIIKKVPRLPSFASTLLIRMAQENTSLHEASELIKQDPSSVAVVLKAVNSTYYGFPQKVCDVNRALILIGFSRVYQLIIEEGLQRTMPSSPGFTAIQSHSVAISHIAFGLSLASRTVNPSEMSTIGLLHDLGRGLILLLKKQNPSLGIFIDSLDHARLCALLLKEWGMPDILVRSLEFQSYPEILPPDRIPNEIRSNVALLYLAHLCFELFKGVSDGRSGHMFTVEYRRLFDWHQMDLRQLVRKNLLPTLVKGINGYPIAFRNLVKEYIFRESASVNGVSPPKRI